MSRLGLSILIAFLLVVGLTTAAVRAQETAAAVSCDRYASPTGSDTATGGAATPFRSAVKLVGSLSPGQTGCFRSGAYALNDLIEITTREIALTSYPGERAKIVGRIWVAPGADGVRVENLDLDGRNPTGMPSPTVHAHDTVFRGNDVTNAHTGICFNLGHGSYGRADRTLIEGNRIHHCGRLPATNHDHGIYVGLADDTVIRGNWIYANADRGVQLYPDADGSLVVGNVIDANGQGVLFSGGTSSSSDHNVVEHNVITNATIRYNVEDHWQGPQGVGNVAHENCVWTSRSSYRGDPDGSGIEDASFTASANRVAKPSFANAAEGDYTLDPDSSCGQMLTVAGSAPPPAEEPPADTTPPETTIVSGPSGTITTDSATFEFTSSAPGCTFECRLDGSAWSSCATPKSHSALTAGSHTFQVRATDAARNVDQTAASRGFKVKLTGPSSTKPNGGGKPSKVGLKSSTSTARSGDIITLRGRIKSGRAPKPAGSKAKIEEWQDGRWTRFVAKRPSRGRFEVKSRITAVRGEVYFRATVKRVGRSRPVGVTVLG